MRRLDLEDELRFAMHTASEAARAIMAVYVSDDFGMQTKDDGDRFGKADINSNHAIVRALINRHPDHGILTEEKIASDDMPDFHEGLAMALQEWRKREFSWHVDSLDGSVDFERKTGMFGVHICLTQDGSPILGLNHYPVADDYYFAIRGKGAFYQSGDCKHRPIRVSDVREISQLKFAKSTAFPDAIIERMIKENGMPAGIDVGSMGLKICKVASGDADVYLNANKGFSMWDSSSGGLIVSEAGGIITDLAGRSFDYRQEQTKFKQGVLVSNGHLHNCLLSIIKDYILAAK